MQIKEMLLVNVVMANVFNLDEAFQKILSQQYIISTFQQIKEMLLVSTISQGDFSPKVLCNAI
jgi:hypothetical protein